MEFTFNEVYISHQMKTKPWILNKTWITVDLPVWPYLAEIAKSGRFHYRTSTNTWTWEITTFVEIQMEVATHKILTSPLLKKVLHARQRGRVLNSVLSQSCETAHLLLWTIEDGGASIQSPTKSLRDNTRATKCLDYISVYITIGVPVIKTSKALNTPFISTPREQ